MRKRIAAALGTAALLATSALTFGATPASAAPAAEGEKQPRISVTFRGESAGANDFRVEISVGDEFAGHGVWIANGDRIIVEDFRTDGYYVRAFLGNGLEASTKGKPAISYDEATRNLPEGSRHDLRVCLEKAGDSHCSRAYTITA